MQKTFANNNNVINGKGRVTKLIKPVSHQKKFLGTVFMRMYLILILGWLFYFLSFFALCHVTSISVFISYLFHFECIMANVQMFLC